MPKNAVVLSLAVLAGANIQEEWHQMPNGLHYHQSCIHQDEERSLVDKMGPCPYPPRTTAASEVTSGLKSKISYYSDWSVYAQHADTKGFGSMSNDWVVPKKPTSKGPAPPLISSSVYLFNGLEDGNGNHGDATLILQPVLQYGKSGCLLNPTKFSDWYLTAYSVNGAGRAVCGKNIKVEEGEVVRGIMTLINQDTEEWRVDAVRVTTGETSTVDSVIGRRMDAAYLTMEGIVIYNCAAYPASGTVTFTNNTLADRSMNAVNTTWKPMIRHSECEQAVDAPSNKAVSLSWKYTKD